MESTVRRGYASFTPEQEDALRRVVHRKRVIDLGSGEHALLARWMNQVGASHVLAVDSAIPFEAHLSQADRFSGVVLRHGRFVDLVDEITSSPRFDVGVISWPANHPTLGLSMLADHCDLLVVITCNVDSTVCGSPPLWRYLSERCVEAQYIHPRNVMTLYGAEKVERAMTTEEYLGIANANGGPIVPFRQAYG